MRPKVKWQRVAGYAALSLILSWRAERMFRTLPRLSCVPAKAGLPSLSIIIPARNEEVNLGRLLPTLKSVTYPGSCEIIVVDDQSSDRTPAVAAGHGAKVISLDRLPPGWLGKPYACHNGALAACGDWLLFTDADTLHASQGPAQAVSYALQHGLDGLSAFLQQESQIGIDRLALMVAYAGLFAGQGRNNHLLNGQYILIRRQAYLESGGFSAVRNNPLEDVALGHHLSGLGYRVPAVDGEQLASVCMYNNFNQIISGMSRLGVGALSWTGPGAITTVLLITAVMYPWITLYGVLTNQIDRKWLCASWGAAALSMLPWARRFGSPRSAWLAPVGGLLVQVAACWGIANRILGRGQTWKGRQV